MSIKNQQLKKGLDHIALSDWVRFANKQGLLVLEGGATSHYINIRDPKNHDPKDPRGLITTVTPNCFKQANEAIFKRFLKFGISEDDIWRGLGKLK